MTGTIINNSSLFILKSIGRFQRNQITTNETDICIEGFQRSGNSFIYRLFKLLNPEKSIAHHTHASQNIYYAIKYKVPHIVLVRNPIDAITSLLVWDESLSVSIALYAYRKFYRRILLLGNDINIVEFESIVNNPSEVINFICKLYPEKFNNYDLSNLEFDEFKKNLIQLWDDEKKSPLPNEFKERRKSELRTLVTGHEKANMTIKVYNEILDRSKSKLKNS